MAKNPSRQVNIFVNGRAVANNLLAIRKELRGLNSEINGMTKGSDEYNEKVKEIAQLKGHLTEHRKALRGMPSEWEKIQSRVKKLNEEIFGLAKDSEEYNKKVKELARLKGLLDDHKKRVGGVASSWDKIKTGVTRYIGFATAAFTADAIVGYGQELFGLGSEMEALARKAEIVFGEALPAVNQAAVDNANAMGLTISQYTDASAAIGDLLIPMGFQRKEAADMSTELVNLSGALSEWSAGQHSAEEVSKILGKALLGEREQLEQLGVLLREADVDARIAEKGLSGLTGKMLQQAKAAATLELITERSADAQAAYAANADLSIRKQAQLTAQLETSREQLAQALLPVFNRLLATVINVADGITGVTTSITNMIDPVKGAAAAFDEQSAKVATLENQLVPLLDRYDELTANTNRTEKEQKELEDVIKKIGEITPTAITQVDEYGKALGINAVASRELLEAEKARLKFVNEESISTTEKAIASMKRSRESLQSFIAAGEDGHNVKEFFQAVGLGLTGVTKDSEEGITRVNNEIARLTERIQGADAELKRLRGDDIPSEKDEGTGDPPVIHPTPEEIAAAKKRAEELQKEREAQAKAEEKRQEAEAKELERHLDRLRQITLDFAQKNRLENLEENERELEEIRIRFREQIDLAKQLETQGSTEALTLRLQLEEELQTALDQKREEQFQKQLDRIAEENAKEIEAELAAAEEKERLKTEAKEKIAEFVRESLSPEDEELAALEEQFDALVALAGIAEEGITKIVDEHERRRAEIRAKFDKEERKATIEQTKNLAQSFGGLSDAVGGFMDLIGDKEAESAKSAKVLAAIQIAAKTGQAIASGVASALSLPFPANIGAIATTVGVVLANFAQAKAILSEAPELPQKYKGGYFSVRGQEDKKTYRAQYIGTQPSGLLPSRPVVLASEAGPEYFVSHRDLRNPKVLNYVQAIDNIVGNRRAIPQFQEGGATAPLPATTAANTTDIPSANEELARMQIELLREISSKLDTIQAVFGDEAVVDIFQRFRILQDAAGGTL